jgi:hypothetical protein
VQPSTTEKACVALLFIESDEYILDDFWFLGCLCRSNYPLHITMRFINLEFQMTQSPPRLTEVNALIQLNFFVAYYQWHDIRFWGRLSRSNYPSHITIRFIKSERTQSPWRSTKVNTSIQLILLIGQCRLNDILFLGRLYSGLSGPFLFWNGQTWSGFWIIPCAALALWQRWPLPAAQQFRWLCSSAAVVAARGPFVEGKAAAVPPTPPTPPRPEAVAARGRVLTRGLCFRPLTTTRWLSLRQPALASLELEPRTTWRMCYHMWHHSVISLAHDCDVICDITYDMKNERDIIYDESFCCLWFHMWYHSVSLWYHIIVISQCDITHDIIYDVELHHMMYIHDIICDIIVWLWYHSQTVISHNCDIICDIMVWWLGYHMWYHSVI